MSHSNDAPSKQEIEAAAAHVEDSADHPRSVQHMISTMNEHSDGTNVLGETLKTFGMSDGKTKATDIRCESPEEALQVLQSMVEQDKQKYPKKAAKWAFRTSPHEQFGKTLEDSLLAFVRWANVGEGSYNVSKAFRRLEHYAEWMEETGDELTATPLTAASVQTALQAWGMNATLDKSNNLVWWIDFGKIDKKAVKTTIPHVESLRAFVWYSHFVLYNEHAQANGIILVETVNKVGFLESMTLVTMKLGVKLDRLTIGVLPVKMKTIYIMESPKWLNMFMKLVSMFMSKKMKERIVILKDWETLIGIVGKDCIPKPFGPLEGSVETDTCAAKYFS